MGPGNCQQNDRILLGCNTIVLMSTDVVSVARDDNETFVERNIQLTERRRVKTQEHVN